MNRSALRAGLLLGMFLPLQASIAAQEDHPEIRGVIESFRAAIVQRDKPRFLSLFIKPDLPWQSVLSDESLVQVKADNAHAIKARFNPQNNPTDFIDHVVNAKGTSEETFSNPKIDADSDVATVTFDYTFLADGQVTNHGKECWLLVRTEDGWKITTLAYSITLARKEKLD